MCRACAVAALICFAPTANFGQEHTHDVLVGGRVYLAPNQPPIEDATVIVANGKIRAGRLVYERPQALEAALIERLRDIQQELLKAWLNEDRGTIERLLAPDWTVTGPTGVTSTRAQILADFFERRIHRLLSGAVTEVSVRLVGTDAAVVSGHTQAKGTYDGVPYAADIRFTDVFERHGTDWRAVRSHASSIVKP